MVDGGSSDAISSARGVLVLGAVAVVLLVAGCSGVVGSDKTVPAGDEAAARYASLESYEMSYELSYEYSNRTRQFDVRVLTRRDTGELYEERIEQNASTRRVVVANESGAWQYDAERNEFRLLAVPDPSRERIGRQVRRLFDNLTTAGEPTQTPSIPAAPVVPGSGDPGVANVSDRVGPVTVTYAGTEQVADRDAHVVEIRSVDHSPTYYEQRVAFDTEWFLPLNNEITTGRGSERVTIHQRVSDVTFGTDIPDERFALDLPENATEAGDQTADQGIYRSRAALERAAGLALPDPALDKDYRFRQGGHWIGNGTEAITLRYATEAVTVQVTKTNRSRSTIGDRDGERVRIAGHVGTATDHQGGQIVAWTCPDTAYQVGGRLGRTELLDIAESLGCG